MRIPIVSHHAHERKSHDGRVRKPKPQQVGVQISCCFHSQVPPEGTLRGTETAPWRDISEAGASKPDRKRPPDAGPRSHDDFDSTEICVGGRSVRSGGNALTTLLCSASGIFAISRDPTPTIITQLARTCHSTRTRRRHEQYMPGRILLQRHFLGLHHLYVPV